MCPCPACRLPGGRAQAATACLHVRIHREVFLSPPNEQRGFCDTLKAPVPHLKMNTQCWAALTAGIRGGLFTAAMARLNVRIRRELFGSLLTQEIGFFDTSKTGEITSRLAADTTTVSDQICLNLNVALRSATQAAIVLIFMFGASWRLTVVTFILIPLILTVCKFYGAYYR